MDVNVKDVIFGAAGGLGLLLYGMGLMSGGLKRAAGERLKSLLETVTKSPLRGFVVGAGVTCLIQSSSATTVMLVGLVNAGLLTLLQAIGVIIGANIGTTMTAWLVSGMAVFKISLYAMPAICLGFLMNTVGKTQRTKHFGQIVLGFGLLFLGLSILKSTFDPLGRHPEVQRVLIALGGQPILAVLAGTAMTVLLQSSSATVATLQVLVFTGAFGADWDTAFRAAIPFILGDNIGTTVTAQLAAMRSNLSSRRAAMAHSLFNVIGVCIMLPLVYTNAYASIVKLVSPVELGKESVMLYMALAHTLFNAINSLVWLPMVGLMERMVVKLVPGQLEQLQPVTLEKHLLDTPPLAIDQARRELVRMAAAAREALEEAVAGLYEGDRGRLAKVAAKEDAVDAFQTEITRYLVALSQRNLSPEMANELPVLLHSVNDIERVGDHAVNIAEIAARRIEQKQTFSPPAMEELSRMRKEVDAMFDHILAAVANSDMARAEQALEHERNINQMQVEFRRGHVQRLGEGTCSAMAGLIYVDFVDNMEKIGDHLTNIAQAVLGGLQWDGKKVLETVQPKVRL